MTPSDRIPSERPGATDARRLVRLWSSVVVVVVALNLGFAWTRENRPLNRGDWLIREKWARILAAERGRPVETLIVGDSSGNQGADPAVLAAELGGSALNLCTIGTLGAVDDAWMVAEYLERAGVPRRVVVVHSFEVWPRVLGDKLLARMQEIPLEGAFWKRLEPRVEPPLAQRSRAWLARLLPLYGHNLSAARLIADPLEAFEGGELELTEAGFLHVPLDYAEPEAVARRAAALGNETEPFSISKLNRAALERMRALAEEHGFELHLATSPVHEGVLAGAAGARYLADLQSAFEELAGTSERVHLVLTEPVTFPSADMEKIDHVVGAAAGTYSRALARSIREQE